MFNRFLVAAVFPLLMFLTPGNAQEVDGGDGQIPFDVWVTEFKAEAVADGIDPRIVDAAFEDVEPVARIIERDRSQPEYTLTFDQYLNRIATPTRIALGQKKRRQYDELLEKVGAHYGVQPRFIVAIWGIETNYGEIKPTMPVVPALATLAWDIRRSTFFRKELLQALHMVDEGYIELDKMYGSWAGAMGQPQFIPSSYMGYAQDFDGDNRRDIWSTEADVFASIANYLKSHGWSDDQTWGRRVSVPGEIRPGAAGLQRTGRSGCRAIDQLSVPKRLSEWQEMGVRRADGRDLPTRDIEGSLAWPDGPDGPVFMVYRNYQSILRYNCAHHYGLTVSMLADRIAGR